MKNDILKKNTIHSYFEHTKWLLKHHPFASSFEHWNFASNGTLKEGKNDNPIYYAPLLIFQRGKNIILNTIHTPCDSFYYVYTPRGWIVTNFSSPNSSYIISLVVKITIGNNVSMDLEPWMYIKVY
jgi:hypothetical protein